MELDIKFTSTNINNLLYKKGITISCAESCTAGRIASALTASAGSSSFFTGGIVCYSIETKTELLGVNPETIAANDVVSEEVVRELVIGANKLFKSDYSVAITGYAGPDGNADGSIPAGTIWIAVGNADDIVTYQIREDGNTRDENLVKATSKAVHLLYEYLKTRITSVEN